MTEHVLNGLIAINILTAALNLFVSRRNYRAFKEVLEMAEKNKTHATQNLVYLGKIRAIERQWAGLNNEN